MEFFEYVPKWIVKIVETRRCTHCNALTKRSNIQAFGIRKILDGKPATFYVEHKCHECGNSTITMFGGHRQGSPLDLAYEIIEYEQGKRRTIKAKQSRKIKSDGQIEDQEVSELLEFLDKSVSHEDFLKFIGHNVECVPDDLEDDES